MQNDFGSGPLADVSREIGKDSATLIFTRILCHPPERVWRALIEPAEQLEWLPFVADRTLDNLGAVKLRMTDDSKDAEMLEGEVLESERPRLLIYRWGSDVLTWELSPHETGTMVTLRHMTKLPEQLSTFAAGWHICIVVLERFLDGRPVGRIVGPKAMEFGWMMLKEQYGEKLYRSSSE